MTKMSHDGINLPLPYDKRLERPDRRQFLWGGLLLAGAAAAVALEPRRIVAALTEGALDRAVPETIGPWHFATQSGLVLPPQDDLSQRIYDQVLTRVYAAAGLPDIMLLIAYGSMQDAGLQLHRPETCYPGAGYTMGQSSREAISGLGNLGARATYISATKSDRTEQVYYWTRIGSEYPVTTWEEKAAILRENLHRERPDGILVRLSAISPVRNAVLPAIQQFNAAMISGLRKDGRRILLGQG
jgi:EpsI family protein